ncbi:MAG: DUF559 domain-containing protein, partial [Chitinophagaceae bacterium]
MSYTPVNKVRIVTAASLFDGHDAAINIMRRIMQGKGAEIIHLGHNRSVKEIVETAIEEDVQGIAITSYQGGHVEFFKYMKDLLEENGCGHIKIFGGGGGTILPDEVEELHKYGITRIYSPDDGRKMGLEGMIEDVIRQCGTVPSKSPPTGETSEDSANGQNRFVLGEWKDVKKIATAITFAENGQPYQQLLNGTLKAEHEYFATSNKFYYRKLKEFALEQRGNKSTEAENMLWQFLRDTKVDNIKFRRQHIIDKYIADFISLEKKLIIEVDGNIHQLPENIESDQQRTERLNELGFQVIRFTNDEVLANIDGVRSSIKERIFQLSESKVSPVGGDLEGAVPVLGITGTGGAGKSSVTDEIVRRFLQNFTEKTIAVISVDPSKKKTGGALLGDRIRMNSISHPRAYMRSLATRDDNTALSHYVQDAIDICQAAGFDFIILESAGVGQSDASILDYCNVSMYVMTPEYGAASQLEKINMLDYADLVCLNKFDKAGALDALADVKKQYKRNHGLWTARDEELPVIGTMASKFNDDGVNHLFELLLKKVESKTGVSFGEYHFAETAKVSQAIIPSNRTRYLSEISENNRNYDQLVKDQSAIASRLYQLEGTVDIMKNFSFAQGSQGYTQAILDKMKLFYENQLTPVSRKLIRNWNEKVKEYQKDFYEYTVRDKVIKQPMVTKSLSGTRIPKVVLPKFRDWGDILRWQAQENVPGHFPFTAGVFPLKREGEDPTRMFAGEGGPERTNKRFHYVSMDQPA